MQIKSNMKKTSPFRIYISICVKGDVFLRKKIGIVVTMIFLLGIVVVSQKTGERLREKMEQKESVPTVANSEERVVVVDSGHGGDDPGKIGVNDKFEKDINLQIAQKIQKMLEEKNVKVVMTRENEEGLEKTRVEDLKARVDLINQTKPVIAVSIHQNSYPDAEIHGAQVFYYTHSKEGESAAKILQESLRKIDQDNYRQAKANDTYYMLKKTEVPVVIVECGFLSNHKEAELLCGEEYQMKVSQAVTEGILEYMK